jgi:hypothetical protein
MTATSRKIIQLPRIRDHDKYKILANILDTGDMRRSHLTILYRLLDMVKLFGYLQPNGKCQQQNLSGVQAEIRKKINSRTCGNNLSCWW